ncbi:hypothetical protein [Dongia sp.]|uniref:hypothetical protein n=1 Tax=Dongia sp. TaxID=1977262 RepID=UPI0035AEB44D
MRYICFDTESAYYRDKRDGFATLAEQREFIAKNKFRFDCAVAYDSASGKYHSFKTAERLVNRLLLADQLVSHSGKLVDLLILEQVCDGAGVQALLQKRHTDLFELGGSQSLDTLAQRLIPSTKSREELRYEAHCAAINRMLPDKNGWQPDGKRYALKLAKARRDVALTRGVFLAFAATGGGGGARALINRRVA